MSDLPVPVLAPIVTNQPRAKPIPPPPPRHIVFHSGSIVGTASMGASFSSSRCWSVSPEMESKTTAGPSAPMGVAACTSERQTLPNASRSSRWCRSQRSLTGVPSSCTSRMTLALGRSLATAATSVAPPSSGSCQT